MLIYVWWQALLVGRDVNHEHGGVWAGPANDVLKVLAGH